MNSATCKNCVYWNEDHQCEGVGNSDEGFGWGQNPAIQFEMIVTALDDSGLESALKTGPDFGCIRFKQKG